ncbi:hypothetical protein LMH73_004720 [Vibrio splendidus]|nr:hypothetical protein [Vibrio splendidus]MCC4882532.1 hypothetical protein [Vibrio splendidus]
MTCVFDVSLEITSGYVNAKRLIITNPDFVFESPEQLQQAIIDDEVFIDHQTGIISSGEITIGECNISMANLEFACHNDGITVDVSDEATETLFDKLGRVDVLRVNGLSVSGFSFAPKEGISLVISQDGSMLQATKSHIDNAVETAFGWELGLIDGSKCVLKLFELKEI